MGTGRDGAQASENHVRRPEGPVQERPFRPFSAAEAAYVEEVGRRGLRSRVACSLLEVVPEETRTECREVAQRLHVMFATLAGRRRSPTSDYAGYRRAAVTSDPRLASMIERWEQEIAAESIARDINLWHSGAIPIHRIDRMEQSAHWTLLLDESGSQFTSSAAGTNQGVSTVLAVPEKANLPRLHSG